MGNLYTDYNGSAKTIVASTVQTLTFTGAEIPGSGVVAFHLYMTGASANKLANLTRIRIKANSQTIMDFSPSDHFRAFIERVSRANYAYPTTAQRLTIPFYIPDGKGDHRYASQFPKNAIPTIEVVTNSSVVAGTLVCGWTRTDLEPKLYPKLLGIVLNLAASVTNYTFPISTDGEVRGYGIPTTGLNRVKLVLDDVVRHQVDGTLVLEDQQLENPETITDPVFHKLHGTQPAPPGRSYFNLDSGSSWVGAANEVLLWTFHKQGKAA
jgi:hypothetical protein